MIAVLKTAEQWVKPPSHWLGGEEWGDKDRTLTLAYTLYKDGLCACGHPIVITHDDEHDGWYATKTSVCAACAALDRKRDGDDKSEPGEKAYVVDEREAMPEPLPESPPPSE